MKKLKLLIGLIKKLLIMSPKIGNITTKLTNHSYIDLWNQIFPKNTITQKTESN